MGRARAIAAALAVPLAWAGAVHAVESASWPPPPEVLERMQALQRTLRDSGTSMAQRDAAREELGKLLRSPAGPSRPPDGKNARAPRAAIAPFPPIVKPQDIVPSRPPPAEGVAKLDVIEPPRPTVDPRTGTALSPPSGQFAIDPRSGAVLHGTPGGYVDPRTGRFVPR